MVSAAEIAAFVYCPEQWRLEYGLGLEPGNRAELDAGDRHMPGRRSRSGSQAVPSARAAVGRPGGPGAAPALGAVAMTAMPWIAVSAVLALLLGLVLMLVAGASAASRPGRRQDGIARSGDADLAAAGADRQAGPADQGGWRDHRRGMEIALRGWPWHRARWACYFLLIEEELRIRPSHGFIVCGDGTRHRIENSEELRAWVLELAGQIRAARAKVTQPIPVNPEPGQCRSCGKRGNCGQARL